MPRTDSFARFFPRWRKEILLGLMVFLYLLGIALLRGTYGTEDALSLSEIVVFSVLPLIVGAFTRSKVGVIGGILVASMVPFQKTIALVFIISVLVSMLMLFRSGSVRNLMKDTAARFFFVYLGWLFLLWIIRLGGSTDVWSFPILFGSMISIPLFYLILFIGFVWSKGERSQLRRLFVTLLLAQSAVVIAYPLLIGHPVLYLAGANGLFKGFNLLFNFGVQLPYGDPDWNRGTLVDSHQIGFLLAILTALLFASAHYFRQKTLIVAGLVGIYLFGITETSHAVPAFIAGLFLAGVAAFFLERGMRLHIITSLLLICITLFPVILATSIYGGNTSFSQTRKAFLYRSTIEQLTQDPTTLLIGYGPGTFGSRVSNKRLPAEYGYIEYPFPIVVGERVAPAYAVAMRQAGKGSGGATAQVQVSGLVSLVAESGVIGTIIFLLFVAVLCEKMLLMIATSNDITAKILAITGLFTVVLISGSLCFRQYFEYPQIMSFVWLIVLISGFGESNRLLRDG
ncbi:MAG: hypothetical protein WAV84_05625 [Bacteroidota bacterium]